MAGKPSQGDDQVAKTFQREMSALEMSEHQKAALVWIYFYGKFKQNSVHRKFLAETGFRPSYNSHGINEKLKFFTALKSPALWMHWGGWIYWYFCNEDESWRFWSLISKECVWSFEWLWALGEALLVELRLENWGKRRLGQDLKFSLLTAALENFIFSLKSDSSFWRELEFLSSLSIHLFA